MYIVKYCVAACRVVLQKFKLPNIQSEKIASIFLIVIILFSCYGIALNYTFDDDVIYQQETVDLVDWFENRTQSDDRFMFHTPRVLALLTDRVGTFIGLYNNNAEQWVQRVRKNNIRYVIVTKAINPFLIEPIQNTELLVQKVWENDGYLVFEVLR